MLGQQFILPIAHELVVDLFAGGGGASTGIEQAIGRFVDIAVNHDPEAVSLHQANHPQTRHFVSDVFEVDPVTVTSGQPVGLLWASPDCKHFSKAKGGKPVSKKIRGLAWVVIKWAKLVRPRIICLENVEEFQTWGPLADDGRPCPDRKGMTFRRWKSQLENLGYQVEHRELRACDYGAPTIRKRLFLVARCDGQPIVWPQPTHGPGLQPYRTAAECIDWSLPCPSIFERERPLAETTMRRIAHGIKRYVLEAAQPFIVHITHSDGKPGGVQRWGKGAHAIDKPLPTLTTKAEHCLAVPTLVVNTTGHPGATAEQPLRTVTTGGHHALVAAFLAKHFGGEPQPGKTAANLREPAPTVLAKLRGTSNSAATNQPLATVSAQGFHHAEVRALLTKFYGQGGQDQDVRDPLHTIPTHDRFGLVTVAGELYSIADIGMRMLQPRELYCAQGFPDSYIIDRGADGRALSKAAQVRMCGNSVCPPLAQAIVRANYAEHQELRRAA